MAGFRHALLAAEQPVWTWLLLGGFAIGEWLVLMEAAIKIQIGERRILVAS